MAAGDLITGEWQWEYNGLLIGRDSPFQGISIDGLSGYQTVRNTTVDRFGRHGAVPGRHYLGSRQFVLKFDFFVATHQEFKDYMDMLSMTFGVRTNPMDEMEFVWMPPGRDMVMLMCRPIDVDLPFDRESSLGHMTCQVRFEATHPFPMSMETHTVTIDKTSNTTGLDFPLDFPLDFGPSTSDSASVTNAGTAPGHWTATIIGPATAPLLEEASTSSVLNFPALVIEAGETLNLDSLTRDIKLNGTASRRGYLDPESRWFDLPPQVTTGIRYSAANVEASSVVFSWQDMYWFV